MSDDSGGKPPSIEYLAGFLDGEGCFTTEGRIAVSSTDRVVLETLAATYGGRVTPHSSPGDRTAASWQWRVPRKTCAELIPRLLPYLHTKRDVAGVVLELARIPRLGSGPEFERARRMRADHRARVTDLNRRGA